MLAVIKPSEKSSQHHKAISFKTSVEDRTRSPEDLENWNPHCEDDRAAPKEEKWLCVTPQFSLGRKPKRNKTVSFISKSLYTNVYGSCSSFLP